MTEHLEYFKMLKRMIRAGGRRAGLADEIELAEFVKLRRFLEDQIKEAVLMQVEDGRSWAEIGSALGVSKQAAFKKYSK